MEAGKGFAYRGLGLTAAEIADALWLAAHVTVETSAAPLPTASEPESRTETPPVSIPQKDGFPAPSAESSSASTPPLTEVEEQKTVFADLYRAPERSLHQHAPMEGIPFYAPDGKALPNKLHIARALRPLLRRVPSLHQMLLDEQATAEAIAEGDDLALVLRPKQERWLDLVLLIDESPSMVIWHHAIQELHALLTELGAFRSIESWGIGYHVDSETQMYQGVYLHITSGGGRTYGRRGHARELINSTQRRLILLLSDSSSPAWRDGGIAEWLNLWGQHNLVTLVQFMPRSFWSGTGLGQAVEVVVSTAQPGSRNSQLTVDEVAWYWTETNAPSAPPVPVITLDPRLLHNWAQLLSGRGQKQVYGYSFLPLPDRQDRVSSRRQPSPPAAEPEANAEARLLKFQRRLSPPARQLAGYLAAVPLSLPVMRLVQQVLLPDTTQLHLAEVFHSGILRRSSARYVSTLDPDTLQYDFLDDSLRDLFLTSIGDKVKHQVLREVSEHIDKHSGLSYSFQALLFDPNFTGRIELDERGEPFARVAAQVLRSMGGIHAELAKRLAEGAATGIIEIVPDLPLIAEAQAAALENAAAQSWQRLQETAAALLKQTGDCEVRTLLQGKTAQPPTVLQTRLRLDGDSQVIIPPAASSEMHYAHESGVTTFVELRTQALALWQRLAQPGLVPPGDPVTLPHIIIGAAPLNMDWCWVPGGKFQMGSNDYDRNDYDREKPIHEVHVDGFWLARYPVTNAQYRLFIEARGYDQQKWWTAAGWQTRQKEKWTEPRYWGDTKWNGAQQPVVGVSWYEAVAFCAWAAEATGEKVRLPTEAEWEKGARGTDGRIFPWGKTEPNEKLCNFGSNVSKTTPVGQYSPQGDSPYRCADISGNVWEWCRSKYASYPYQAGDGRHDGNGTDGRVVRGGSWNDNRDFLRCAFRLRNAPDVRYNDVGFRCASTAF